MRGGNFGLEVFSLHRDKGYSNPTLCRAKDGAPLLEMPQNHPSGSALPARYSWESYSSVSSPFFLLTRPPLNFSILLRSARVAFGWPMVFRAACFTKFAAFRGFFFAISGPFQINIPARVAHTSRPIFLAGCVRSEQPNAHIPARRDVCGTRRGPEHRPRRMNACHRRPRGPPLIPRSYIDNYFPEDSSWI